MAADPLRHGASEEPGTFEERRRASSPVDGIGGLRVAKPVRTLLARFLGFHVDGSASRNGANSERVAGWWLGQLPTGWHVFNDIPVGEAGTSVDHLVIGPGGVFTINTKTLTGKIWLGPKSVLHNRRRTDYLPRASAEAHRASRFLSAAVGCPVPVRGALAILADDWTIRQRPIEIYVDATRGVKDWLLRQPRILSPQEVAQLAAAASKPGTWLRRSFDPPG